MLQFQDQMRVEKSVREKCNKSDSSNEYDIYEYVFEAKCSSSEKPFAVQLGSVGFQYAMYADEAKPRTTQFDIGS